MKFIRRNKERGKQISGWQSVKDGFEVNASPEIISRMLTMLVKERRLLTLADATYISPLTMAKDFTDRKIIFARVEDWPEDKKKIRILFKDDEKLWSHFDVDIISTSKDDIETSFPLKLYRLQRRDHFRLLAPTGSMATFVYNGKKFDGIFARDISAGGMLLSTQQKPHLKVHDEIEAVTIHFPAIEQGDESVRDGHVFHVKKATVMHVYKDTDSKFLRFGIAFQISDQEKEEIMQFVRQRELEMLRKWS